MPDDMHRSQKYSKLPEELLEHCRTLRRNSTTPEQLLWYLLRDRRLLGYKFRRQHPAGRYILDFYCHEANLGIELDGGGHLNESQSIYDETRTEELTGLGIKEIRFWNNEVMQQTEAVLEVIVHELQCRAPRNSGE